MPTGSIPGPGPAGLSPTSRPESDNGEISVKSNVLVYRFRSGEEAPYVGSIDYTLRWEVGDLKIAYRRAVLDLESLSSHGALSIIF